MLEALHELPGTVRAALRQSRSGGGVRLDESAGRTLGRILEHSARRREAVTIGAAVLLGGLVWLAVDRGTGWPGWAMLLLGAGWILLGRSR